MASEPRGCLGAIFGMLGAGSSNAGREAQQAAKVPTSNSPRETPQAATAAMAEGARETPQATKAATFPYTRTVQFLSPAESSFLSALRVAVGEEYEIFAKVRVLDVLDVRAGKGWQAAFNKVQAKQLDFLLCERGTSRPVLAVELDDSSHRRPDRRARDAFVEEVLEVIGLPALRCPVTRTYDPGEIARLIKATVSERLAL